jgi:hypothetical protein
VVLVKCGGILLFSIAPLLEEILMALGRVVTHFSWRATHFDEISTISNNRAAKSLGDCINRLGGIRKIIKGNPE